jgi:hypothetical protein
MLLPIHIAAGGLAIVLGAGALSVKKGGTIHNGVRSQQMHVHFRTAAHDSTTCTNGERFHLRVRVVD